MAAARVLIVDDEELFLTVAMRIISRAGYDVRGVCLPRQALEMVKNEALVAVVLADVVMPDMRGPDLIKEISRISPQTVSVLMTGYTIEFLDLPENVRLLRKPMSAQDLITAVELAV